MEKKSLEPRELEQACREAYQRGLLKEMEKEIYQRTLNQWISMKDRDYFSNTGSAISATTMPGGFWRTRTPCCRPFSSGRI